LRIDHPYDCLFYTSDRRGIGPETMLAGFEGYLTADDPFADLRDVHARLPTMSPSELPLLLPDRWIADHPQHRIQQQVDDALGRAQRARRATRRATARGSLIGTVLSRSGLAWSVTYKSSCCRTNAPRCSSGTSPATKCGISGSLDGWY
jgi:hypothetical protein